MYTALFLSIIVLCLSACAGSDSGSSSDDSSGPSTPPRPMHLTSVTEGPTFQTILGVQYCTLRFVVTNDGGTDSPNIIITTNYKKSEDPTKVTWGPSSFGTWVETGSQRSIVPAGGSLSYTFRFPADDAGNFWASVGVSYLGYLTTEVDDGGGMFSSQFFPPAAG
jgi:hypothetical protein